MKLGFSDGYRIIKILDANRVNPVLSEQDINDKISKTDDQISRDLQQFGKNIADALEIVHETSSETFTEKLVYLRMHACLLADRIEAFVETLDEVLHEETTEP